MVDGGLWNTMTSHFEVETLQMVKTSLKMESNGKAAQSGPEVKALFVPCMKKDLVSVAW